MAGQSNDPAKILSDMLVGGQEMMRKFGAPHIPAASEPPAAPEPPPDLLAATKQVADMQQQMLKQAADFWSGMFGGSSQAGAQAAGAKSEDKRFASEPWRTDPRFDAVRSAYLAYTGFLQQSVDAAPVDEKTKGQLRFAANQFADAMSPSNFFVTNPEAMQLAQETGGQSVIEGMRLLLRGCRQGAHLDDRRERVRGRQELGGHARGGGVRERADAADPVHADNRRSVRTAARHHPALHQQVLHPRSAAREFFRGLCGGEGHPVFLVSWRNITSELGTLTWDDYLAKG